MTAGDVENSGLSAVTDRRYSESMRSFVYDVPGTRVLFGVGTTT